MGFTKGGRIEYNHFILQYIVERANRTRSQLIFIALDFKKAFDSIDRSKMIEVLIRYKVHPNMIDIIARIYNEDRTVLTLGDIEEELGISSGIKQGCTTSTALFKLVTYMIMSALEEKGEQHQVDNLRLSSIFYCDDSILIAKTLKQAIRNLKIIIEVSRIFGLHINKEKSSVVVYNNWEKIEEVEGIKGSE